MGNRKLSLKDVIIIAIFVAIAVIMSSGLGVLLRVIPFSRTYLNAPFFSFLVSVLLFHVRKPMAVSMFGIGFGLTMLRFSVFSTIPIIFGAVLADIVIFLLLRGKYEQGILMALLTPLYSVGGVLSTYITVTFITESQLYQFDGLLAVLLSCGIVYVLGAAASLLAYRIYRERLQHTCERTT